MASITSAMKTLMRTARMRVLVVMTMTGEKQGQLLVLRILMEFERKNNSEIIVYNDFHTRF